MEGIKLKKDGIVAWGYKWLTGKKHLPESLCKVFWLTLLSWLLMSIFSPIFLLTLLSKDVRKDPSTFSFFITLMLTGVIVIILTLGEHLITNTWKEILFGIGFMVIIIVVSLLFLGLMYVIGEGYGWLSTKISDWRYNIMTSEQKSKYLNKKYKSRKEKKPNAIWNFISVGIESFMGKYCPRINWK